VLAASAFDRRVAPLQQLREQAEGLALAAQALAGRFAQGGRLLVMGNGSGTTDAQHVAVEFVHPVTVGARSLPALSLAGDAPTLLGVASRSGLEQAYVHQVALHARPGDAVLALSDDPATRAGLAAARERELLTLAILGDADVPADHRVAVSAPDHQVLKEAHVTAYHVLWELVHVFLHVPRTQPPVGGLDALYPFLYDGAGLDDGTVAVAAESARRKVDEVIELRAAVGAAQGDAIERCAEDVAARVAAGGTVIAFGNGGSSTDAEEVVHAFADPPPPARPVPALALVSEVAVLTALSNDVGFEVVFARQLDVFARQGDVAVALSTSGGSRNVLAGLERARAKGLLTVALAGGDGGLLTGSDVVDHLFTIPSRSVHRVQEVQTTVTHVLREAVSERLPAGLLPPPPARG
jgi:D-sedoheptulose 7-phosphate isomerase